MKRTKTEKEALEALFSYCNYQERCSSEVLTKLSSFDISNEAKDGIIEELKEFNYLNDERFTESYVRGKHSLKGWGKNKIRSALFQKKIAAENIDKAFNKILDAELYEEKLEKLFHKKWNMLSNKKDMKSRQKLFRYLYAKGYESSLINTLISQNLST